MAKLLRNCGEQWDLSELCRCPFHEEGVLTAAHVRTRPGGMSRKTTREPNLHISPERAGPQKE